MPQCLFWMLCGTTHKICFMVSIMTLSFLLQRIGNSNPLTWEESYPSLFGFIRILSGFCAAADFLGWAPCIYKSSHPDLVEQTSHLGVAGLQQISLLGHSTIYTEKRIFHTGFYLIWEHFIVWYCCFNLGHLVLLLTVTDVIAYMELNLKKTHVSSYEV